MLPLATCSLVLLPLALSPLPFYCSPSSTAETATFPPYVCVYCHVPHHAYTHTPTHKHLRVQRKRRDTDQTYTFPPPFLERGRENNRMSDAYHSCYTLSGLSSAQHQWVLDELNDDNNEPNKEGAAEGAGEAVWAVLPYLDGPQIFDSKDRVRPIHPVYAIPQPCIRAMKDYFDMKQGF